MKTSQARQLSNYHAFTRKELHDVLRNALENEPDSYWKKPAKNGIQDLGSTFNLCVKWVGFQDGINGDTRPSEIVAFRVLQYFGKHSDIQIPNKPRKKVPIQRREAPKL